MKKWIFLGFGAVVLGLAIWQVPRMRLGNPWLDGKDDKVTRGDLIIPVGASGAVAANQQVELKSKAGGRVKSIGVKEGQPVNAGQVVMLIDPVDENRAVERLEAEFESASAAYEQAQISLTEAQQNRPLDTRTAKQLEYQAKANMDQAKIDLDRIKELGDEIRNRVELPKAEAIFNGVMAIYEKSKLDFERIKNNEKISIDNAKEQLHVAQARKNVAQKALDDAKERRKETTVIAPTDGMVYGIPVTIGQVTQSGTSGFTGGTPLMYIADTSKVYVIAQVDEADIGSVQRIAPDFARPGSVREPTDQELRDSAPLAPVDEETPTGSQPASSQARPIEVEGVSGHRVRVTVDAYRDERFEGIIEQILPMPRQVGNVTTFDVRIRLVGDPANLVKLLGKQADVTFTADRRRNVLKVKNEAIVAEGKEAFVYVPNRERQNEAEFERKVKVQIGLTDGTYTEVISGLNERQRIWVKRPQRTNDEQKDAKKNKA